MGRALLVSRLVIGDIRHRPVQSALLLVMITTTTATLALGLALHRSSESPFARARAATKGPDVVVDVQRAPGAGPGSPQQFASVRHAPGVVAVAGPYPVAFVRLTAPGISVPVQAEGRDLDSSVTDRPLLRAGRWTASGGAVLEQGLAASLGLHVGDTIHLSGHPFRIAGIALTTEQPFYPASLPALVWLTRASAVALVTPAQPIGYVLGLKLADPATAPSLGFGPNGGIFGASSYGTVIVQPWQQTRADDYSATGEDQSVLLAVTWLLALLAIASIAVVVGSRMAEQTRRVGLLKAVGATPRLVALTLLAENLLLAIAAAIIGLVAGELIAPVLANSGSALLGSAGAPAVTATMVAEVILAAVVVAIGATALPAIRGARASTIGSLNDAAQPPRRRPVLIALSARLPVPLLLGLRLAARRPRRTRLTVASLAIAVATVVTALAIHHGVDVRTPRRSTTGFIVEGRAPDQTIQLVIVLSMILVILAAVNAIFITWTTVIDAQRPTALARAIGATPRQISAALTAAQLFPALAACCVGIPAGVGLYLLVGGAHRASPPLLWLVAVIPGTLLAVGLLTAIPARIGAHRSVAEVLRTE